jgi:hypothetical protein
MSAKMREREDEETAMDAYEAEAAVQSENYEEDEAGYEEEYTGEYEDKSSEAPEDEPSMIDNTLKFAAQDKQKALVDEAVEKTTAIYRQKVDKGRIDKGRMEIGAYLLEKLFKGDITVASSTDPQKCKAYDQFEKHKDLPVKAPTIRSWVRAAAVYKGFDNNRLRYPRLTTSHYLELAAVQDEALRAKLANMAQLNKSSVQDLRKEINKALGKEKGTDTNVKAEVARIVRQLGGITNIEALTKFSEDEEALSKAYPTKECVSTIEQLDAHLCKLRSVESVLSKMADNLRTRVDRVLKGLPQ